MGRSRLAAFAGARRARLHSADSGRARLIVERLDACTVAYAGQNHSAFQARALRTRLASRLHSALLVKAPEFDADALLERIAKVLGDCLAVGSMNRKTGALTASLARAELWAVALARAAAGTGSIFPGVRLAAVAAVLNNIAHGKDSGPLLQRVSIVAEDSRIIFQYCPWDERDVLFVVLPDDGGAETNFALLRIVLESLRRDVAIVRAPRVEARCLN